MITKTLENIIVLNLVVTLWSARRKLKLEDLKVAGNQLPPEDLASLGSKKICDPEKLKVFNTLKSRATRYLDTIGVRFLGGWAIPAARAQEVADTIEVIKDDFYTERAAFLDEYDLVVTDWINKHPEWTEIIAKAVIPVSEVERKMSFGWQAYMVTGAPAEGDNSALVKGLEEQVSSLGGTLFQEISSLAREVWEESYQGKEKVTRRALRPLRTMADKLRGLSFLDPRALPIVESIEKVVASMPERVKKGDCIQGTDLMALNGLLLILCDPEKIVEHGQKIIDGADPNEALFSWATSEPTIETTSAEFDEDASESDVDPAEQAAPTEEALVPLSMETSSEPETDGGLVSEEAPEAEEAPAEDIPGEIATEEISSKPLTEEVPLGQEKPLEAWF